LIILIILGEEHKLLWYYMHEMSLDKIKFMAAASRISVALILALPNGGSCETAVESVSFGTVFVQFHYDGFKAFKEYEGHYANNLRGCSVGIRVKAAYFG
jgi:hypothetical protein